MRGDVDVTWHFSTKKKSFKLYLGAILEESSLKRILEERIYFVPRGTSRRGRGHTPADDGRFADVT